MSRTKRFTVKCKQNIFFKLLTYRVSWFDTCSPQPIMEREGLQSYTFYNISETFRDLLYGRSVSCLFCT